MERALLRTLPQRAMEPAFHLSYQTTPAGGAASFATEQSAAKRNPGWEKTPGGEPWKGRRKTCPDVLIILGFRRPSRGWHHFFCFPRVARGTAVTRSTLGYDPSSLRD